MNSFCNCLSNCVSQVLVLILKGSVVFFTIFFIISRVPSLSLIIPAHQPQLITFGDGQPIFSSTPAKNCLFQSISTIPWSMNFADSTSASGSAPYIWAIVLSSKSVFIIWWISFPGSRTNHSTFINSVHSQNSLSCAELFFLKSSFVIVRYQQLVIPSIGASHSIFFSMGNTIKIGLWIAIGVLFFMSSFSLSLGA